MRLSREEALARLAAADHGVLATIDADRGVTLVPVCFAISGDRLVIPVDAVKPKAPVTLRRARNLAVDPRAALLCERWDADDWTRLWWARADLSATDEAGTVATVLERALRERYPQYRDTPFERLLTFEIVGVAGWTASA
jgi:PPOX class probable F420-dependent enzyme